MPIAQPWAFCNPPLAPQVAQDWGTFSQHAFCTIMTGCMVMLCSSATTLENLKGQCHAVFTLFPFISIKKKPSGRLLDILHHFDKRLRFCTDIFLFIERRTILLHSVKGTVSGFLRHFLYKKLHLGPI